MFLLLAVLLADSTLLVRPPLPGFKIVNQTSAGGVTIVEQIPRGETVEKWSRLVTIQRFEGVAVAGSTDMHVYQVAWRRVLWPADVQWALAYLDGVTLKR